MVGFGDLITATELKSQLGKVKLFDIRWSLTDPNHGRDAYSHGHIPGAVFVDLDTDLSTPEGDGRHPLPTIEDFGLTMSRLGLSNEDRVVVYDDSSGAIAARLWWMLTSVGHETVAVLDGGLRAWTEGGYELETASIHPEPGTYLPKRSFAGVVRHDELGGRLVLDVRNSDRYSGDFEPVDSKAGHIPGAINIPISSSLDDRGEFRRPEELRSLFLDVATDRPVISCGSGVNACHTALAMRLAGLDNPDVYIGSFSDWSSRDLPVVVGSAP